MAYSFINIIVNKPRCGCNGQNYNQKGKPIEVEGAYVSGKLNLFQLRELEALPFHNIKLSDGKYFVGGNRPRPARGPAGLRRRTESARTN